MFGAISPQTITQKSKQKHPKEKSYKREILLEPTVTRIFGTKHPCLYRMPIPILFGSSRNFQTLDHVFVLETGLILRWSGGLVNPFKKPLKGLTRPLKRPIRPPLCYSRLLWEQFSKSRLPKHKTCQTQLLNTFWVIFGTIFL